MLNMKDKTKCSGCGACYSVCPRKCISMKEDDEGFLYPDIDNTVCVDCGLCEKVCPMKKNNEKNKGVLYSCILQHSDDDILKQSTSGAAFTPIAEYILDNGGVVFGVQMQMSNCLVKHIKIEKKEKIAKFRGSKYVQSNVGDTFIEAKEELDNGRLVCFSGTPCQIQGLQNYLKKDYNNLVKVDVVCRGVPSPGIWKSYSDYLGTKGEIENISFRNKTLGYQYSTMEIRYKDGKIERNGIESDQWLRMFFSGMTLRPSCSNCNFRTIERCSDFTIWDCFNVSDITKEIDETKGATKMLIHTKKGLDIFNDIKKNFYVVEVSVEKITKEINATVYENKKKNEFIEDYNKLSMEELLDKWFPMSMKVKMKMYLRRILNKMKLDLFVKKIVRRIKG